MSGGVDSSLAAHLLVEQGYDVTGVYLECWRAPGCRTEEDRKDALQVALKLGIPFQVLDFKQAYRDRVVENFFAEYAAGRTPNPDVMCNKEIKFGLFYDWAMSKGFDFVATGHYAQRRQDEAGEWQLCTAADEHKDQSYFLYLLSADQLAHTLFPIGHLTKPVVRNEATKRQIHTATKKDSVGICFIGDINVHAFLRERLGENPGPVVDVHGTVIGEHRGLWFYTIGQRHGFSILPKVQVMNAAGEIIDKHQVPPFYVVRKVSAKNQLVVGFGTETFTSELTILDPHFISSEMHAEKLKKVPAGNLFVRIRHTGKLIGCNVMTKNIITNSGKTDVATQQVTVILDEPTQGIAEGQSAVFYLKESRKKRLKELSENNQCICIGGGVISDAT